MKIRFAEKSDTEILSTYDKHIRITELESAISLGGVIVAEDNGTLIGATERKIYLFKMRRYYFHSRQGMQRMLRKDEGLND